MKNNSNGQAVIKQSKRFSTSPVPLLLPLIIVLAGLFIYPMVEVLRYSFTNMRFGNETFSYTLSSYSTIFGDSDFLNVLRITFVFVFFSVVFQFLLGFIVVMGIFE